MSLHFIPIGEQNRSLFERMMQQYCAELEQNSDFSVSPEMLAKWIDSILDLQAKGDPDRHLEYCYIDDTPIGFLYGKVDHPHHRGYKKVGWGYIMEFFVIPPYRRIGFGCEMQQHLEELFLADGTTKLYLTTASKEGEAFWVALGVRPTDEISPENGDRIYTKELYYENFDQ